METRSREHCKIRKRGNSSSSSSSLAQKYRFKRAIPVGKRAVSGTPVPTWMTGTKSPTSLAVSSNAEQNKCSVNPHQSGGKSKEASVSARKLAATLWEINKIPSPSLGGDKKELRSRERVAKLPRLSDPSFTLLSERMDRSRGKGHRRRASKKLHGTDYNVGGGLDSASHSSLMEIETHTKGRTDGECIIGIRTRLKDVSNGLATSKELLKVLYRIWAQEERHSSDKSLVSALRVELDRATTQVHQLIKEQRSDHNEIEFLVKRFEEEKAAWKSKERERIRDAISCIADELGTEKKLRRQSERLNKKLGKELADVKATLSAAMKELESEKREREILEQVCDELAKGIGEDRAEVEELKRESAKAKEAVEREREMLQLADVFREERVQMKLSEAKYHFEEKNAAVERLRDELDAYLRRKVGEENIGGSPNYERIRELEAYLKEINLGSSQKAEMEENESAVANGEVLYGDDSADSDLHSIELNMEHNNRSYKWSYPCVDNALDDLNSILVDKNVKGRKSVSDHIEWRKISLHKGKGNGNGIPGTDRNFFITKDQGSPTTVYDRERLCELGWLSQTQDQVDESRRHKSSRSLGDQILSGSKRTTIQNFTSPTRQWGQTLQLPEPGSAGCF